MAPNRNSTANPKGCHLEGTEAAQTEAALMTLAETLLEIASTKSITVAEEGPASNINISKEESSDDKHSK